MGNRKSKQKEEPPTPGKLAQLEFREILLSQDREKIIEALSTYGEYEECSLKANANFILKRNLDVALTIAIERNENFCQQDRMYSIDCRSFIHDAVLLSQVKCLKVVVELGKANINATTSKFESGISEEGGWTPIALAQYYERNNIANYLESQGATRVTKSSKFCGILPKEDDEW